MGYPAKPKVQKWAKLARLAGTGEAGRAACKNGYLSPSAIATYSGALPINCHINKKGLTTPISDRYTLKKHGLLLLHTVSLQDDERDQKICNIHFATVFVTLNEPSLSRIYFP